MRVSIWQATNGTTEGCHCSVLLGVHSWVTWWGKKLRLLGKEYKHINNKKKKPSNTIFSSPITGMDVPLWNTYGVGDLGCVGWSDAEVRFNPPPLPRRVAGWFGDLPSYQLGLWAWQNAPYRHAAWDAPRRTRTRLLVRSRLQFPTVKGKKIIPGKLVVSL